MAGGYWSCLTLLEDVLQGEEFTQASLQAAICWSSYLSFFLSLERQDATPWPLYLQKPQPQQLLICFCPHISFSTTGQENIAHLPRIPIASYNHRLNIPGAVFPSVSFIFPVLTIIPLSKSNMTEIMLKNNSTEYAFMLYLLCVIEVQRAQKERLSKYNALRQRLIWSRGCHNESCAHCCFSSMGEIICIRGRVPYCGIYRNSHFACLRGRIAA